MTFMTPSQRCKAAGLKSLRELATISSTSTRTLENWSKHNQQRFAVILAGAVAAKAANADVTGAAPNGKETKL